MSGGSLGGLAIEIGEFLLGRYRIESVIAEGGTGIVLAAHDLTRKAEVAIKLLRRALDTEELRTRFGREARATAQLSNPHVVRVIDAGALADGSPYMVMERLEGRDLARVLREDGRLPVAEAVDCMLQVCDVLREAHGRGIVHRDLKPANLILTRPAPGGVDVKVLDFGISKIVTSANAAQNQADTHQEVTVPFTMLGSPRYMAPEQVRNSKDVDGRADLWSVGAVLFQLVTGDHAFAAEGAVQASVAVLTADPRDLQELAPHAPFGLADVIKRCLAKDVEDRWQTAGDLVAALRPFGSRVGRSTAPIPPLPVPVPAPGPAPAPEVSTPRSLRSLVEMTGPPPPPISERTRTERMAPVTPDHFARVSVTAPAWGRSDAPPAPARTSRFFLGAVCTGVLLVAAAGMFVGRLPSSIRVTGARATGQAFEPQSPSFRAPAPAASVVLDAGTPSP